MKDQVVEQERSSVRDCCPSIATPRPHSAIWFAHALGDVGGRLTTVEIDSGRAATARANLQRAGFADRATVVHGDGGLVLAGTPEASVDLLVLDAERPAYVDYWREARRVLTAAGIVAVDNARSHEHELTTFVDLVRGDPEFVVQVHDVGDGVLTAVRTRSR